MRQPLKLVFIRHGDPDYLNDTLTEKGWREAGCLADRIGGWGEFDAYCSPLGRAKDTAARALSGSQKKVVVLDWLSEFRGRIQEPLSGTDRIPWDFLPATWTEDPGLYHKDTWFQTELMKTGTVEQIFRETCKGLDQLLQHYGYIRKNQYYLAAESEKETGLLVLFCHFGITMAALSYLLGIPAPLLWQGFYAAPTSVTVLGAEEREPGKAYFRCQMMGDTRHLQVGHEPIASAGYYSDLFQG